MLTSPDPVIALPMLSWALCLGGGYLLGSIPFGVIATRLGGAGDIRKVGSGNIGATNVLRTGRRDLAALTLIGDGGKGAVAALLARHFFGDPLLGDLAACLAAGAAFLGHLFPIWLQFRGGKGMATFFGAMIAIAWPAGLAAGATWIVMAAIFRISSLAALVAVAVMPLLLFALDQSTIPRLYLAAFMAVLVFIRHHENIRRLLKGEEPRIGGAKATPAQ